MLTQTVNQQPRHPQQKQVISLKRDLNISQCGECGRDVYRNLAHKRFYNTITGGYDFKDENGIAYSDWLKNYAWQDIEYVQFHNDFVDVMYQNELIIPHGEINNEKTESAQISLV